MTNRLLSRRLIEEVEKIIPDDDVLNIKGVPVSLEHIVEEPDCPNYRTCSLYIQGKCDGSLSMQRQFCSDDE